MYIKILEGRYAGQVRDIENGTALALLANGRATKAFADEASNAPRRREEVQPLQVTGASIVSAAEVAAPKASRAAKTEKVK